MNMNPMQIILNQMMNSPMAQQNVALKGAIEKYNSGDNQGAIDVVKSTLQSKNVNIEQMQQQTMDFVNNFRR